MLQGNQLLALSPHDGPRSCAGSDVTDALEDWARHSNEAALAAGPVELEEALRLATSVDLYNRGYLPPAKPGLEGSEDFFARKAREGLEASGLPWLTVQLPVFQHPVLFAETQYHQDAEVPPGVLAPPLRDDTGGG